ncbi:MAG TPA: HNH endonuclease [Lacunisphaera sp.]|nr:HNH endonuclease [Lacunisphaera sp.]
MTLPTPDGDISERLRIFRAVAPYFGKVLPAAFFQKTTQTLQKIERLHNLAGGIFKPAWSNYALSIASMLKSPYHDRLHHNPDGTWWIQYSPRKGGMEMELNVSLLRCRADRQPVLVLHQVSDKTSRSGARHRFLGLGIVEDFDAAKDLFRIREMEWDEVSTFLDIRLSGKLIAAALRQQSLEKWTPFVEEEKTVYQVSQQKRDDAFSEIVLDNYGFSCAVTGQRFYSSHHTEAHGAHIISKKKRGTDDPRNGVALSQSVHWAFDRGIFTISDQYEVVINPKARRANVANFQLMELDRKPILLPKDEHYHPHLEALAWHKKEVFDRFTL